MVFIGRNNTAAAPGSHKTLAHNVYPGSRVLPFLLQVQTKGSSRSNSFFYLGGNKNILCSMTCGSGNLQKELVNFNDFFALFKKRTIKFDLELEWYLSQYQ